MVTCQDESIGRQFTPQIIYDCNFQTFCLVSSSHETHLGPRHQDGNTDCQLQSDLELVFKFLADVTCVCRVCKGYFQDVKFKFYVNPLNAELNPICYLLALLAHHFLHVSRIRVKSLTLRLLMSYMYIWSTHS